MRARPVVCALLVVLAAFAVAPALGQDGETAAGGGLPVATVGEWTALALEGGLFFARSAPTAGDVSFVYGYDAGGRNLRVVASAGGSDLKAAIESLGKAFADTLDLPNDGKAGDWKAMSYAQAYALVASSNVSPLADVMLESLAAPWAGSPDEISVANGYCQAGSLAGSLATAFGSASAEKLAKASAASSSSFSAAVTAACADIFPSWPPTPKPAFPIYPPPLTPPPGYTPPSGPGGPVWLGGTCTNFGQQAQCMDKDGALCMCSCQGAGTTGTWQLQGGCSTVPGTAPASPCSPAGGIGPCTVGGKRCACNCVAPPATGAPPGSGTWVALTPPSCAGSAEAALGLLLATALCGVWLSRRSTRIAARR
jgi:hypothetical protein